MPVPPQERTSYPDALTLHTTARGRNIADVSRDVQEWHDAGHGKCRFNRVVSAEMIKQDGAEVVENWTIEACNQQQFTYQVLIMRRNGSFADLVSNVDGSPLGSNTRK